MSGEGVSVPQDPQLTSEDPIPKADERLAKLIAEEVYGFAGISDGTS